MSDNLERYRLFFEKQAIGKILNKSKSVSFQNNTIYYNPKKFSQNLLISITDHSTNYEAFAC